MFPGRPDRLQRNKKGAFERARLFLSKNQLPFPHHVFGCLMANRKAPVCLTCWVRPQGGVILDPFIWLITKVLTGLVSKKLDDFTLDGSFVKFKYFIGI